MYKAVLFDLDGTLNDSGRGIKNSFIYTLNKYNIPIDYCDLDKVVGPPLFHSFTQFYGFDEIEALEAIKTYREYYKEKGMFENDVYPNVYELLNKLKENNIKIAIATSKPIKFTVDILKYFKLYDYFDFVSAAPIDDNTTTKADIIRNALDALNIDKKDVVMVGDREYDIIGANINDIDSIGVLYGYGNLDEFKKNNATFVVNNVMEILDIVLGE